MSETTTRLWLLRHGQTEGGACFRGRIDLPLTAGGEQAMATALRSIPQPDRVISSPLQRCRAFAERWAARHACPFSCEEAIQELDFGRWDGRSFEAVWTDEADRVKAFWADPYTTQIPEGEAVPQFESRVHQAVQGWIDHYAGETLLVVGHGGVMRVLLKWALSLPERSLTHLQALEIGYACLIQLELFTDAEGGCWPRLVGLYPAASPLSDCGVNDE